MESKNQIEPNTTHTLIVSTESSETRLDTFVTHQFPRYSRTFFQKLINRGAVTLNGKIITKPGIILKANDVVIITFPPAPKPRALKIIGKDLGVQVVAENPNFLIVFKPAGLLVHVPSPENTEPSLVDWLAHHFHEITKVGAIDRPGIVHRLDKDTSGLLIIARNNYAHSVLADMFRHRQIEKKYLAVVKGHPDKSGTIDYPISRHPINKHKMTHTDPTGREAITHYKVLEYFDETSLVEAKPVTGRTHQIRVHFSGIGHPIIGDTVYGKKSKLIKRQALHAYSLAFDFEGEHFSFTKDVPEDFQKLLDALRKEKT